MVELIVFRTDEAPAGVLAQARTLMDRAFDGAFADVHWDAGLGGRHAVALDGDTVVAHASVIERTIDVASRPFRTGYVENVATEPSRHGEGLGSKVMAQIDQTIRRDFDLGALSTGRHSFYERLGWERWAGPAGVRSSDGRTTRTPAEDDGVMVLRFGPSAAIDLTSPISCEERPGEDW